ncbi:ubiquitin-conjugating enzyme/RWD-like protein [Xylogone sp. PMI_703]|nr:ubiquitin-conjugating enzyme/RWD-like protein [Xylogone sp. PMI_703]
MVEHALSNVSAVRKQNLLVEFSSLKYACPQGVYLNLTPGDPTLWSGVLFVRSGPYASAVLRFQISFPSSYPSLPPLILFSTDIFHPLITPLTTYTYTTDVQDSGTVSASDEERLPPGGFSLRHGFPAWFGRATRRRQNRQQQRPQTPAKSTGGSSVAGSEVDAPASVTSASPMSTITSDGRRVTRVPISEVLQYVRSTFDDAEVLDKVPLDAAGNPGAWHAWRAYRVKKGIAYPVPVKDKHDANDASSEIDDSDDAVPEGYQRLAGGTSSPTAARRRPGEWNWDGVWEVRVMKGVEASASDPVLYGNAVGDELIHFLRMESEQLEAAKESWKRAIGSPEPIRRGVI